jgi:pyruvate ferredoxin oxidoreductase beta subunit
MVNGPSYIHILSVCPTGWRIPSAQAIRYGRLAVEAGVFPLYEIVNGKYSLTYNPEPLRHMVDYFNGQGRYRHLTVKTITKIQERINSDWKKLKYLCGLK